MKKDYSAIRILYIGPLNYGGTCLNRMMALRYWVESISCVNTDRTISNNLFLDLGIRFLTKYINPAWIIFINLKIIIKCLFMKFDYIWIDKGLLISPKVLKGIIRLMPMVKVISYSPDDMMNPGNQSRSYLGCLEFYDLNITTKSYNVHELANLGARNVMMVNNSFSPFIHKPYVSSKDAGKTSIDVGFIGTYEFQRCQSMLFLAEKGISVSISGRYWKPNIHENVKVSGHEVLDLNYAKLISDTAINLCFLRKVNRDLQTTRSVEIPACGGFMLAERTEEHLKLFEEGIEAEFFDSDDELASKVQFYLRNERARLKIANAGFQRCIKSGYSDIDMVEKILEAISWRH